MIRSPLRRALTACALSCSSSTALALANPAEPSGPGRLHHRRRDALVRGARRRAGGRPLIMVNGGPGFDHTYVLCSDAWDVLARSRRVVFYDQRGTGRSSALRPASRARSPTRSPTSRRCARSSARQQIDLLGHSWGGYLVMAYAARHPDRVAHLIIADSAAPKWSETEFIFKYIFPEAIEHQGQLDFFDMLGDSGGRRSRACASTSACCSCPRPKRDEFLSHADDLQVRAQGERGAERRPRQVRHVAGAAPFRMPTLVMTGRYDINVAPSTAWKIHKAIPGSRWEVFENSGHLPYFEEPEKFVQRGRGVPGAP